MVERLAREAARSFYAPDEIDAHWARYIPLVLNLLVTMREPTANMTISGEVDFAATSSARRVWRGMIDVAMTDEPSELDRTRDEEAA